jgi:hypothetical protein
MRKKHRMLYIVFSISHPSQPLLFPAPCLTRPIFPTFLTLPPFYLVSPVSSVSVVSTPLNYIVPSHTSHLFHPLHLPIYCPHISSVSSLPPVSPASFSTCLTHLICLSRSRSVLTVSSFPAVSPAHFLSPTAHLSHLFHQSHPPDLTNPASHSSHLTKFFLPSHAFHFIIPISSRRTTPVRIRLIPSSRPTCIDRFIFQQTCLYPVSTVPLVDSPTCYFPSYLSRSFSHASLLLLCLVSVRSFASVELRGHLPARPSTKPKL